MLLVALSTMSTAHATEYYRYQDKDGNTVMGNALPPEVANQGYEVLNSMGEVVEKIPPRKSEEELQKEAADLKKQQAQQKQIELQHLQVEIQNKKDEILLKSFNNLADIERTRDDKINAIQLSEEIMKENLIGLEKQLLDARNAASHYQQNNQKLPENLQTTIDNTLRQINENQEFLKRKEQEKTKIRIKYQAIIERFKQLQQENIKQ